MRTVKIFKPAASTVSAGTLAVVAAIFAVALTFPPKHASATPAYAKMTGHACGFCHVNVAGGGRLNATGKAFQKRGHKM